MNGDIKRFGFVLRRYKENALDAGNAWRQFAGRQGIRHSLPFRRYLFAAAASLLLLIGAGSMIYLMKLSDSQWVIITAGNGERKDVFLPDSTCVTLAGNSELRYNNKKYGKKRRAVQLKGKAFFEVTRDESRPFSIQTKATETVVLGTSFMITETKDSTSLYIESGKVSFSGAKGGIILTAGMSAVCNHEAEEANLMDGPEQPNILAWKTGELVFNNTPLYTVIRDLSEYYRVRIINNVQADDNLKLTATFTGLPVDEVLLIINQTLETSLAIN